jgi:EAL and modified HD-GYP domain-containing signal transduction protein
MVNTPAFGLSQEVESLNQAIMLLGRKQLQRWIQVLMYTEAGRPAGYLSPILLQASARAHLMEALSNLTHPDQPVRAEAAFTTGILSIMDQLFQGTMQDLLAQVNVDVPIREALLRHEGELGLDLRLATLIFPSDRDMEEDPIPLLQALGVNAEQIDR